MFLIQVHRNTSLEMLRIFPVGNVGEIRVSMEDPVGLHAINGQTVFSKPLK